MKVKFCPKCGNTDIKMIAGGGIGLYECKKCRFSGSIFPEKEIENKREEKTRKSEKK